MTATTAELRTELQVKNARLKAWLDEAGDAFDFSKVTALTGTPDERLAAWRQLNAEVNDLGEKLQTRLEQEASAQAVQVRQKWLNEPAGQMRFGSGGGEAKVRTFDDIFAEPLVQESVQRFKAAGFRGSVPIMQLTPAETKTLMTLTTLAPVPVRQPGIRPMAQEQRTVRDLMLQGTIGANAFTYVVETTFTNAAAETTEGSAKPESAIAFTETTETVATIATWIPATRQILDDLSYMQSYIEERLRFMVARREEVELLTGDGIAPNVKGILNRSGLQTQAAGADTNIDAIYKAIVKVRGTGTPGTGFAEPTAIVIHPNNWQTIILTKTSTGDYVYGNPADPNVGGRLWGLEVRQTSAETANTALVGAFQPDAQVFQREGITVMVSTEHDVYFTANKVAILAEERVGLAVYRPSSFCKVTGLS